MKLIVQLKPSVASLALARACDSSPRGAPLAGFVETAQSMRRAVEEHVLACQEMVKRAVPRGTRVDALPGMHVLIVHCGDGEGDPLRTRVESACEYVIEVAEDVEMELIA
jgi:hypothetical protein